MKQDQIHKEKAQRKLNNWKSLAENLNILLHIETAGLKDEFEDQKKNLSAWLISVNDSLQNFKDLSDEEVQKLKSSIEMLRFQTALGKAETEDNLKEQQQKINEGIQQLQIYLAEGYDSSKGKIGNFTEEVVDKLADFHTRFDLFRLQLHLGKEEAKEDWEQKKKEISNQLQKINIKIANGFEDQVDNWDHFSVEITEAWKHIKNAFTV